MISIVTVGLGLGSVYALVAVGYAIIYRTTGIINFAQGAFVVVGSMGAAWLVDEQGWPLAVAAVAAIVLATLSGLVCWIVVIVPMWRRDTSLDVIVLSTLVVAYVYQNLVMFWMGTEPLTLPAFEPAFTVNVLGARIVSGYVWLIAGVVVIIVALEAFLRRTSAGRVTRAVAADREVSQLLGISPLRTGAYGMCLAAAIGGLGGVLITPVRFASYDAGLLMGVYGFVAAMIGGFGSLRGAVCGGLLVGVVQQLCARYVSSEFSDVVVFTLLLVFLTVRPRGLLGDGERLKPKIRAPMRQLVKQLAR